MDAATRRPELPLEPLLGGPTDLAALLDTSSLGGRFRAVVRARREWLTDSFLDTAPAATFAHKVADFYDAVVPRPFHPDALRRKAATVRHGVAHLLRGRQPLPVRVARCVEPGGPYFVPGVGPAFWSAVAQALDPAAAAPGWCQAVVAGVRRVRPGATYPVAVAEYTRWLKLWPGATALHLDDLLARVGQMRGRELGDEPADDPLPPLVRRRRSAEPLRALIRQRGAVIEAAQSQLRQAMADRSPSAAWSALALALPLPDRHELLVGESGTFLESLDRLLRGDDPGAELRRLWRDDPLLGLGVDWPAAALHLRDPRSYPPLGTVARRGLATLDDAARPASPAMAHALDCEAAAALADRYRLHPFELPGLLALVAAETDGPPHRRPAGTFGGFCRDTWRFLAELAADNRREWLDAQRPRYRFAVRQPLAELGRALAARYVGPVLGGVHGWAMEPAVSGLARPDVGSRGPYREAFGVAFVRQAVGRKRDDVHLFVRLDRDGLAWGLRLGRDARRAGRTLRRNVQEHAEPLFAALSRSGALEAFRFGVPVRTAGDLRAWAAGKELIAEASVPPDAAILRTDALVGEILLAFDKLVPLFACAAESDPARWLHNGGPTQPSASALRAAFCDATFYSEAWLDRALELARRQRQLVLQGVPGTGKTHVARHLARVLAGGRDDAVRLVQFHPSFGYEEFVEGIKPQAVDVGGRTEVAYPVEPGLLLRLAADAAREPGQPFVLVIDELNRGNLPRIFGELLFLLEYRDQTVTLPYSRQPFRLPANVLIVGTMNGSDRSIAPLDKALRRRFAFVDMPPDTRTLARWLERHPPRAGERWAGDVVRLFEGLNARLERDLGPAHLVGHSPFLVDDLSPERLRAVWAHQILPLLADAFLGQPAKLEAYSLERLLGKRATAEA